MLDIGRYLILRGKSIDLCVVLAVVFLSSSLLLTLLLLSIIIAIVIRHLSPSQKVVNKSNVLWGTAPYKTNRGPFDRQGQAVFHPDPLTLGGFQI